MVAMPKKKHTAPYAVQPLNNKRKIKKHFLDTYYERVLLYKKYATENIIAMAG